VRDSRERDFSLLSHGSRNLLGDDLLLLHLRGL
jgi:hypothetical protein